MSLHIQKLTQDWFTVFCDFDFTTSSKKHQSTRNKIIFWNFKLSFNSSRNIITLLGDQPSGSQSSKHDKDASIYALNI